MGAKSRKKGSGAGWKARIDSEKCALCEVCIRSCPTKALLGRMKGDRLEIHYRPALCDGCDTCVERCPEEAITVAKGGSQAEQELLLTDGEVLRCGQCGNLFSSARKLKAVSRKEKEIGERYEETCFICRRTHMVAEFIEERRDPTGKAVYKTGKKWKWRSIDEGMNKPPGE